MRFPSLVAFFCLSIFCSSCLSNTPCPKQCHCYVLQNVHQMNCSNSMLEQFLPFEMIRNNSHSYPTRFVSDSYELMISKVIELDISHNKMEEVPNLDDFCRLKRLNLGHNRICSIPDKILAPLKYLEELNLSHNQISQISKVAFKNLFSLQKIDLGGNKLKTLPLLLHIPDLKELYLDDNLIEDILPELLNSSNLQTLSLANNRISYIQPMLLIKLKNLNLAQNPLIEVPQKVLRVVASTLIKLNLSSTLITTIRSNDFANLLAIQEIDLSNNKIAIIEENSFQNLPKLQKLYLNDNPELAQVYYGAFRLLPSLVLIHLHHCNLSRLHDLSMQLKLPSLQHLTLYGNPLLCDCNLTWLQHFKHILLDRKGYQNLYNSGIVRKCPPRRIDLSSTCTAMERQRLVVTCDTVDHSQSIIQWRDSTNTETLKRQFLMFEKINRNQFDTYRCLAYSSETGLFEAKISVDIPPLQLQMHSINSIITQMTWSGKLPLNTTELRVRFRNDWTEFVIDAVADEQQIIAGFFSDMLPKTVIDFCLLDGEIELICDHFDNRDNEYEIDCYILLAPAIILCCLLYCLYCLVSKLGQVVRIIKMLRMAANLERNDSNASAVKILTKPKLEIRA
ncbi:immunoglobulin I-set domain-containing protein [Loa loa]|uniref:Immunoglobulin I-set domain-containing protein n=2 Tax=Loa loa TaxID=7209 RepID=A0A1S0U840_LOALO|nr:immunoglobulin I-set domain-containing protein [Loa loa]EFO26712.2 immunoglobulin I-set domain-containing protein [Loa loa]